MLETVSGAQFSKQTDFILNIGKKALNGMTPSAGLECAWIDALPDTVQFQILWSTSTLMIHQVNCGETSLGVTEVPIFDVDDNSLIDAEVEKYPPTLVVRLPDLYNSVIGKIAYSYTNVADTMQIGE